MNIINLKIIFRSLLKNKFYTLLSIIGISLTFIFLCIIFIFVRQMKGNILPEVYKDMTVSFNSFRLENGDNYRIDSAMAKYYLQLKEPEYIAYMNSEGPTLYHNGQAIWTSVAFATGDYFNIFKFKFLSGRGFTKEEETIPQIVLTESYAKKYFKKVDVVGEKVEMQGEAFTVIGVVEDAYLTSSCKFDMYAPYAFDKFIPQRGMYHSIYLKLKDKSSQDRVNQEINKLHNQFKSQGLFDAAPIPEDRVTMDVMVNNPLLISIGIIVILLLLIPGFNILSLNTGRIVDQSEELAIKKAYGATKKRILKDLLVENFITTLLGAIVGLLLTTPFIKGLNMIVNLFTAGPFTFDFNVSIDIYIILAIFIVAVIFSLISSFYPAIKTSGRLIIEGLKGGKS